MSRTKWVAPCTALLVMAGIAAAQPQQADPPSRVARVSYISGSVSFEPSGVDQWTGATLNYPMTTGDNLYTDTSARAVLRIGRNSVRLAPGTNFQVVNLSDQIAQMSINSGALSLRVRNIFEGESWEVDTPNGAITLLRAGEYRIDTDANRNATMLTVRNGDVEVTSNNQSFAIHAGQTAYLSADAAPDIRSMNPPDDFDSFASSRDRLEDVPPPSYVSPDLPGYEDLAANGTWQTTPDYGPVWTPRVDAGWVPYHTGHWAWVDPWGWTWVDDAPWGFAPFHYGRWAYIGNSWGWCPGPIGVRPIYAPALVAFVGGGGFGVGLSIGGGGGGLVGWFPLGPREAYYPSYHVSNNYVRNVNITNTNINVTNINVTNVRNVTYVNQNVAGAVSAMPQNSFASAVSVQRAAVRITPQQVRSAQIVGTAPPVVPQRASVLGAQGVGRAVAPPAAVISRPVVARIAPPPAPVAFAAKQQFLQQHPGQPLAPQQLQTIRQQQPAAVLAPRTPVRPITASQVRPITPAVNPSARPGGMAGQPAATQMAPRPGVQPTTPQQVQRPGPGGQPVPPVQAQRPGSQPLAPNTARPNGQPLPPPAQVQRPAQVPPAGRPTPEQAAPPMAQPRSMPQQVPPPRQNVPAQVAPRQQPVAPQREDVPAPRPVPQQQVPPRQAPQMERPAPQAQRPAPQVERPAPQVERPVPQAQRPAPQVERPAPQAQRPAPQAERPAPQAQRPAPQAERPQPAPPRQQAAPRPAPQQQEKSKEEKKERG